MDPKITKLWTNFGTILGSILGPKTAPKEDQKWDNFWKQFWSHLGSVLGLSWGPDRVQPANSAPAQGLGGVRGGLLSLYILLT